MSLVAVGQVAPDFTLQSTTGGPIALSGFRGRKVVLAFFPLAFTSVCTAEMCAFSEDYGRFADADTVVLPISVDSVPTLKEFKAKERLSGDLLSDFKREVSRQYGMLDEERFLSRRGYVLIDREGIVRWVFVEETPAQFRKTDEILAQLAQVA
jgi:peroxiredoxin